MSKCLPIDGLVAVIFGIVSASCAFGQDAPDPPLPSLSFTGISGPDDASIPGLSFSGIAGANTATVGELSFAGWPTLAPVALGEPLIFEGWGGGPDQLVAGALKFEGWAGGPNEVAIDAMLFEGWGGGPDQMVIASLIYSGLGPMVEVSETFDGPGHGWTANDGPQALEVSTDRGLCARDYELGDLTLTLPERFTGDWGAGTGTLSFRVFYEDPSPWPFTITVFSPHGTASFSASLRRFNNANYADVERSLDDIWWQGSNDFPLVRRTVERVEMVVDLRDGRSGQIEACIDNVILRKQPLN